MSLLKWSFVVCGLLAFSGRFGFADDNGFQENGFPDKHFHGGLPPQGDCHPPMTNSAAESLHQGGLDVSDIQHVNVLIASNTPALPEKAPAKSNEMSQTQIDAILDHLDSAKERWLKKIARQVCPKAPSEDDSGDDDRSGPPRGGPGGSDGGHGNEKMAANDADSIMKQITRGIGLNTGEPDMPKNGKKSSPKKDDRKDFPAKDVALDSQILAKTDEVEDEIQDALDDREDKCEALAKKQMKKQQSQMTGQMGQQQMQGQGYMTQGNMMGQNLSMMGMGSGMNSTMMMGQGYMPSAMSSPMSVGQMGGIPTNVMNLQSAYLNPYQSVYNNTQSYSGYYYNPYLQRYVGY
jgi:hypothetical protein